MQAPEADSAGDPGHAPASGSSGAPLRGGRRLTAAIIALAVAHVALYLWHFDEAALFNVDVERDLARTWTWLTGGAYPFQGPNISDTQYTLGSLVYLLLAIPMSIGPDPALVRGFFVLCASLALVVFGSALRRFVRPQVVLVVLGTLAMSNFWYENLRQLWQSNLLPLIVATTAYAWVRLMEGHRRWWLVVALGCALAVQLHATLVVLGLACTIGGLWLCLTTDAEGDSPLGWGWFAAGGLVAAVALTPFILGLVFGEVQQTRELDRWLGYGRGSVMDALGYLVWSTIPGLGTPSSRGWLGTPGGPAGLLVAVLAVVGIVRAMTRRGQGAGGRRWRPDFPVWLVLVLVFGLAIQLVVFEHELSTRYLHANAWAVLLLAGLGLDAALDRLPRVVGIGVPAALGLGLVAMLGIREPLPSEPGAAYCALMAQRAAAETVVDSLGIPAVDLDKRVHGLVCRHRSSGYRWFYRSRTQSRERAADVREQDLHAFLIPDELPLRPAMATPISETVIGAPHRRLRVIAYTPLIDYHRLARVVTRVRGDASALPEAGRRAPGAGDGLLVEQLDVPVAAGAEAVHLRYWQGRGAECPLAVTFAGQPLTPESVDEASQGGQRLERLPLGGAAGRLVIRLGPCADLDAVEVF